MEQATVAVCSTDPLIVFGVEHLLRAEPGYRVLPADGLLEARVAVVVAKDVDDDSHDLMSRVARSSSAVIVLVADRLTGDDLVKIVKCRVVSVLSRSAVDAASLGAAMDQALAGRHTRHDLITRLMTQLERSAAGTLHPKAPGSALLSTRERDVLSLIADGLDTAEIAASLAYSERTIKNIVQRLLSRLELQNRAHAVAFAMRLGAL
ncbi:response regulator transcription factor [Lentzea sp. NPDC051213]|uniref:response regulator transcription factor n=1 Tax=Lentzea sp. NPDC051213 TaxID=3364126 RepID=UPI0037BA70C6